MTVSEFIEKCNEIGVSGDEQICVHVLGTLGGFPCVKSISKGFDWNDGRIILHLPIAVKIYNPTPSQEERK